MRWLVVGLVAALVANISTTVVHAAMLYEVTDLGFRGQRGSGPYINANRQVVGNDSASKGVFWENGSLTYLPVLPGTTQNVPNGITDSGQIVGQTNVGTSTHHDAILWENGTVTELLPGYNANPLDISNDGNVFVGWYTNGAVATEAFVWDNGTFSGLGTFGGTESMTVAVNNMGQAVGQIPSLNQWFLWDHGTTTVVDGLGHGVQDINDAGQVVGQKWLHLEFPGQACVWQGGQTTLLGTLLPNDQSVALAINNTGLIVGQSYRPGTDDAILWKDGELLNLNDLLLDGGWQLTKAEDINDEGYIVGEGINPSGQLTSFLLTPTSNNVIPEPSALAVWFLLSVATGFGAWRRRRKR